MTKDLAQWLGEQLHEDERTAREVRPDPGLSPQDPIAFILAGQDITFPSTEAAERHIGRFTDPARVLRDIDAKRELLSRYEAMAAGVLVMTGVESILSEYRRVILPQLALPYADRPGYRDEWRP